MVILKNNYFCNETVFLPKKKQLESVLLLTACHVRGEAILPFILPCGKLCCHLGTKVENTSSQNERKNRQQRKILVFMVITNPLPLNDRPARKAEKILDGPLRTWENGLKMNWGKKLACVNDPVP